MAYGPLFNYSPWHDPAVEDMRDRHFGPVIGFVADRDDPQKRGRVRVHLPVQFGVENVEEHWTDWALPKAEGLAVPPMSSPVVVTFEMGFFSHPMYEPGWLEGSDASSSAAPLSGKGELDETWTKERKLASGGTGREISHTIPEDTARSRRPVYPLNRAWKTEGGHIFEVDNSEDRKRLRYYHPSGTTLLIDADGSVHMRSAGAIHMEPTGDYVVSLKPGGTYKVIYPGGTSIAVGSAGFTVTGHAANILNRVVRRHEMDI